MKGKSMSTETKSPQDTAFERAMAFIVKTYGAENELAREIAARAIGHFEAELDRAQR